MFRSYFLPGLVLLCGTAGAQQYTISTLAGGAPAPTPMTATKASVGDPSRVTLDAAGNLYFSSNHSVYKVDAGGTLTRVAGTGRYGYSGDHGAATAAQFETPDGLAVDAAGNIYVADRDANAVRMVAANGIVTTIAGNGTAGYTGDGGPAAGAQLNDPLGIAVDAQGNLYIADSQNHAVRKVAKSGVISTYAGNGGPGFGGDGGPAAQAFLNTPEGVAINAAGNLYIADTFNGRVRMVAPTGLISTVAGTGIDSFSGDGEAAATAGLFLPTAVAVDPAGNLFICDFGNSRIREITQGNIQTVVGSAKEAILGDDEPATSARLNGPTSVAVDGNGTIYFAEGSIGTGSGLVTGDYKVWKVTSGVIFTAAGNGVQSDSGDGGPAASAQLSAPSGVALDAAGNVYFADLMNNRVRRVAPNGTITTVAGTGKAGFSGDGGAATSAQLNGPEAVALDSAGNLYISDTQNNRIRKVSPGGTISTLTGNGNAAFLGDGGPANLAAIHSPQGLAVDKTGNLYFADTLDQRIREIRTDGTIATVAGNGAAGFSGDGGPATAAALNSPAGVAFDGAGNLYIADQGNSRIRKVANGNIATIAGGGPSDFLGDGGPATKAWLLHPVGVTVDGAGNLYIAQSVPKGDQLVDPTLVQGGSAGDTIAGPDNRLRLVTPDGNITTIAGDGTCCYLGDGGLATKAQLNGPWGLAVDPAGRIYIADSGNDAVRVIQRSAPAGTPVIGAIANAASNALGPIAPGEIVVIYGTGLGPSQVVQAAVDGSVDLPTQLGGVSILVNGTPAQLIYVSATQVSAIVPTASGSAQVVARFQGVDSAPVTVPVVQVSPALFTVNASGSGQAVAVNPDGTANGPGNPAAAGGVIALFLNGSTSEWFVQPYTVLIGGQTATMASPVTHVNAPVGVTVVGVQVPRGLPSGTVQVVVQAPGATSPPVSIVISGN